LIVVLAVPLAAALALMGMVRWLAACLLKVPRGRLASLIVWPFAYLLFSIFVGLLIAWTKQRMAFIDSDTVFWEGDNERLVLGMSVKHALLFLFTVLPITFFDVWLVSGAKSQESLTSSSSGTFLRARRSLGWTFLGLANCLCPITVVVVAYLINMAVWGGR
jgi:hypothetical protein